MHKRTFTELISELQASADEVASLAKDSEIGREIFSELASFVEKFNPILNDLKGNTCLITPPIRKGIESLETELQRARSLIRSSNSISSVKLIEEMTHGLGRCLGLVLFASLDTSVDIKEKIGALHKEMMNARFSSSSTSELDVEAIEVEDDNITLDVDDVVLQLKYGKDEELKIALSNLNVLIRDKMVKDDWVNEEGIIPILLNRLGSSKQNNRLSIIQVLRSLASESTDNKEKLADSGSLPILVKSLTRDVEERREAVGLLSDLSDLPAVRRRIGRIQGCIVMLVAMVKGEDPFASHDAAKLLNALSNNTQNALNMAEAGYFKPLVHYLLEGSEMCKILMATALSRMELTDQTRASLGEDGAIEPLVKMFNTGKLEAKLSSLSALQNLSSSSENIQRLVNSGIVASLLQLLFSVTSVLMNLREPASAILAKVAQSESILVNKDIAQQMLSLLTLSSPVIQYHLIEALNSIASHSNASKVRAKLKENGAIQLLLPFLSVANTKIRTAALNLLNTLSKDLPGESEHLGETHLNTIVSIISTSVTESEKDAAMGLLSNIPVSDKKATDILKKANLIPILVTISSRSSNLTATMGESIAGILIRFTVSNDKKLQLYSAENGVLPVLVKLLSDGSSVAKCRAGISLAQLSQNTLSLRKSRKSKWLCVPPSIDSFCEVHDGYCFVKSTFCLVKVGAVPPMVETLAGNAREADEAILTALSTLLQDEIWENGSNLLAKVNGVPAIVKVIESGNAKAQEKALWILERVFSVEAHRLQFGESAQMVLIDLAQKGDPKLKSASAKVLAQLELLQAQSSYF